MQAIFDFENDKIKVLTLATGQLATNSTFFINKEDNKCIIFDSGHEWELSERLINDLKLTVETIFFTHTHFDHMAAAKSIQDKFGAKIIIHNDDQVVYDSFEMTTQMYGMNFGSSNPVNSYFKEGDEIGFEDSDSIKFKVIHTPGHTPGGVCFYTECLDKPLLIAGDTLFLGSIGRTDLPGGNYEQLISNIKNKLLVLNEDTIVICGHGPNTTIGNEKRNNPFLR